VPMRAAGSYPRGGLPIRATCLALVMFAQAFSGRGERELPPSAAGAEEFRARARPQPSQGSRPLSDLRLAPDGKRPPCSSKRLWARCDGWLAPWAGDGGMAGHANNWRGYEGWGRATSDRFDSPGARRFIFGGL